MKHVKGFNENNSYTKRTFIVEVKFKNNENDDVTDYDIWEALCEYYDGSDRLTHHEFVIENSELNIKEYELVKDDIKRVLDTKKLGLM